MTVRMSSRPRWLLVAAVAAVLLLADQLTKRWALSALADGHVIPVVWTLQLALHHNTGAAFSVGRDSDWARFLPLLVLVAVALVSWRSRASLTRTGAVAVGLVVGGALGNLADRALRAEGGGFLAGGVVDFIDVQWWPVFNVADSGVVVGAVLFALLALFSPDAGEPAGPEGADGGGDQRTPGEHGDQDAGDRLADADAGA